MSNAGQEPEPNSEPGAWAGSNSEPGAGTQTEAAPPADLPRFERPYVVLVTGASSGIGEATARRLAQLPGAALVLVARRQERLRALCDSLGECANELALDLTDPDAPARIAEHVRERHGRLDLLVNNAGAAWRATFAQGGFANVRRTLEIDFDAQLRLTEELLPLLRESAPSAIVNVASTAGRVARAGSGAYSAAKFALAGWSDSLYHEERANDVHVGLVLPGFISTEGFPQAELTGRTLTRWIVSTPEKAAEAIYETGVLRKPERYVPRAYWIAAALRILAPGLVRRALGGGAAATMTTTTGADIAERTGAD
ncbi:MAG TPA: SDR family NAD(P)-dependent oxidoreductase [Solirubrobacteraceae bacterium]|nr:SDR family NAD(P)-dependent oxidoreductase [Solirubrobacteraceae bacterium]